MSKLKIFTSFLVVVLSFQPYVQAAVDSSGDDVEELTYEQILDRLSRKKSYLKQDQPTAFDSVRIHMGVGFINSISTMEIEKSSDQELLSGIQISLGIDLLSRNWYSEAVWRNYGFAQRGLAEIGLRELDLKVGYQTFVTDGLNLKSAIGLATRYFSYNDSSRDLFLKANTPALAFSMDLISQMSAQTSAGISTSYRSPLINSIDRGSLDFGLVFSAYF